MAAKKKKNNNNNPDMPTGIAEMSSFTLISTAKLVK